MSEMSVEAIEEPLLSPKELTKEKTGSINEHSVEMLDTGEGEVTEATFAFLQEANEPKEKGEKKNFEVIDLTTQLEIDSEIEKIEKELVQKERPKEAPIKKEVTKEKAQQKEKLSPKEQLSRSKTDIGGQREALARMIRNKETVRAPFFMVAPKAQKERAQEKERVVENTTYKTAESTYKLKETHRENQEREGRGDRDQQQEKQREKKRPRVGGIERKQRGSTETESQEYEGDIFTRFMALMARILGQAEADAHDLYKRIKERTDNVDILTGLIGKINMTKGKIDWSKDEEMKALVDKVRSLGVEIPEGKYQWSEDEKRLLKENIQMRKDTLEKITQLERTDMQRFMQEASQCHQARSNVLKLMKEVRDTIIHNMRGG